MPLKAGIAAMALAVAFAGAVFAYAALRGTDEAGAVKAATREPSTALTRSDPGVDPWKEPTVAIPEAEEEPEPEPKTEPKPEPEPEPRSEPEPEPEPEPKVEASYQPPAEPEPEPAPEPADDPEPPAPAPEPTAEPEAHGLPDGAVMALTVDALGLRDVPVFDSTKQWALKHGVGHHPDTSLPWTDSPHRNVYVAGHKVGFPGTESDRVFDGLGDLGRGDGVVLRGGDGTKYRYEVAESFIASPEDSWVMDPIRNEDILTLQTCVGPNLSERLIVRAERA